jgi:hypothetical protein
MLNNPFCALALHFPKTRGEHRTHARQHLYIPCQNLQLAMIIRGDRLPRITRLEDEADGKKK